MTGSPEYGALIERLEEGARDLHPYSMDEVASPCLNVALPAYLNDAAAGLRRLEQVIRERDEAVNLLADLASWFTEPMHGAVWVIRAGDRGADDAVNAARAFLNNMDNRDGREA